MKKSNRNASKTKNSARKIRIEKTKSDDKLVKTLSIILAVMIWVALICVATSVVSLYVEKPCSCECKTEPTSVTDCTDDTGATDCVKPTE